MVARRPLSKMSPTTTYMGAASTETTELFSGGAAAVLWAGPSRGGGGVLAEFRPPRWRTKGRRAASIEAGKGPSASGMAQNASTAA